MRIENTSKNFFCSFSYSEYWAPNFDKFDYMEKTFYTAICSQRQIISIVTIPSFDQWLPLKTIEYNCTDKNHWPFQKIITLVGVLMELSDQTTNSLTILKNVNESCSGLLVSPGGSAIISPHNLTFTTNSPEQVVVNI